MNNEYIYLQKRDQILFYYCLYYCESNEAINNTKKSTKRGGGANFFRSRFCSFSENCVFLNIFPLFPPYLNPVTALDNLLGIKHILSGEFRYVWSASLK